VTCENAKNRTRAPAADGATNTARSTGGSRRRPAIWLCSSRRRPRGRASGSSRSHTSQPASARTTTPSSCRRSD